MKYTVPQTVIEGLTIFIVTLAYIEAMYQEYTMGHGVFPYTNIPTITLTAIKSR